ncbi:hypothetical protein FBU30_010272, partial [Linnemannia zychae]
MATTPPENLPTPGPTTTSAFLTIKPTAIFTFIPSSTLLPPTTTTTTTTTTSNIPSPSSLPSASTAPTSPNDTSLSGKPTVFGGFNLTAGILIYSSFVILFLVAIGFAIAHRIKCRRAYRQKMQSQGSLEEGRSSFSGDGSSETLSEKVEAKVDMTKTKSAPTAPVPPPRGDRISNRYTSPRAALFKKATSFTRRGLVSSSASSSQSDTDDNDTETEKNTAANALVGKYSYTSDSRDGANSSTIRFGGSESSMSSGTRSSGIKKPLPPQLAITHKSSTAKNNVDYEMSSYYPGSAGYDSKFDADESDYNASPLQESPSPIDTYGAGGVLDVIQDYQGYPSPSPRPKPLEPSYQSQGQQGHSSPQQKRQSPPPPPKSVKRLSPVSTTAVVKNFQVAQPISTTISPRSERTGVVPRIATHGLFRSNSNNSMSTSSTFSFSRGLSPLFKSNSPVERLNSKLGNPSYSSESHPTSPTPNAVALPAPAGKRRTPPPMQEDELDANSYPIPIMRSNSSRLPAHMRNGGSSGIGGSQLYDSD